MKIKLALLVLSVATLFSACAWVKLTPEGEKVRVLAMDEVSTCKKLGKTTASLKDKIAGMKRDEEKVQKEMQMLARNSAAEMGGDTIVPVSQVEDGRQTFEVFKCVGVTE